jgi:DMSO/TMAO reductase YedYZ molybdopterin-dependent catalytic subunit
MATSDVRRPAAGAAATRQVGPRPLGRRLFLGIVGAGVAGTIAGQPLQRLAGALTRPFTNASGGGLGALVPGADRFRIYTVTGGYPTITEQAYRLEINGLVERPEVLTLDALRALPRRELTADFQCVTGWRVPAVHWAGVRLSDLIDRAGAKSTATAVEFSSHDGVYTESLTLAEARRGDVLVAYEMLGGKISAEHGGPVRLYVAPMYGYKAAKWLKSISLVSQPTPGFWEQQGYDVDAWVGRSNGRTDAPIS